MRSLQCDEVKKSVKKSNPPSPVTKLLSILYYTPLGCLAILSTHHLAPALGGGRIRNKQPCDFWMESVSESPWQEGLWGTRREGKMRGPSLQLRLAASVSAGHSSQQVTI